MSVNGPSHIFGTRIAALVVLFINKGGACAVAPARVQLVSDTEDKADGRPGDPGVASLVVAEVGRSALRGQGCASSAVVSLKEPNRVRLHKAHRGASVLTATHCLGCCKPVSSVGLTVLRQLAV